MLWPADQWEEPMPPSRPITGLQLICIEFGPRDGWAAGSSIAPLVFPMGQMSEFLRGGGGDGGFGDRGFGGWECVYGGGVEIWFLSGIIGPKGKWRAFYLE